jgi:hypothetical protein
MDDMFPLIMVVVAFFLGIGVMAVSKDDSPPIILSAATAGEQSSDTIGQPAIVCVPEVAAAIWQEFGNCVVNSNTEYKQCAAYREVMIANAKKTNHCWSK